MKPRLLLSALCAVLAATLSTSQLAAQQRPALPAPPARQAPAAPGAPPVIELPADPAFPDPGLPGLEDFDFEDFENHVAIGAPLAPHRNPDEIIPARMIWLSNMPLDQMLEQVYPEYSGRTVLRPAGLTQVTLTLQIQTDMTLREVVDALNAVLALNGITMLPFGDKFVKAIPSAQVHQEGAPVSQARFEQIPMADQFITHVVRLNTVSPSEIAPLFATFTKNPAGITAVDSSSILILRDYASNIRRMLELIEKVDVEPETEYTLEVIPIRYGKVEELYNTMNSLITGAAIPARAPSRVAPTRPGTTPTRPGQLPTAQPTAAATPGADRTDFQRRLQQIVQRASTGDEVELLGDARIVPDERSNSLLVYGTKRDIAMIKKIVDQVDSLLAQVLIEAIIMEVRRTDGQTLGVSWVQNPGKAGDLLGGGFISNPPASIRGGRSFLPDGTLPTEGPLPEGFSYFGRLGGTLEAAVQAVATDSSIDVLSRPRIQTSHAIPASFTIGESVPYITGFTDFGFDARSVRSQVQEREIVFRLDVLPFITPDGLITMEISQTFDSRGADRIIEGNPFPVINRREVVSTLSVQDGDTILIGGFITQNKSTTTSGVPILKDIPILGAAFRSKSDQDDRSELIVLLRATMLSSPQIAAVVAEEEKLQLPGIRRAEVEMEADRQRRLREAEEELRRFEERQRRRETLGTF